MSHLYVEDPDSHVACSSILFAQDSFKELTIRRLGRPQKFEGSETALVEKLLKVRKLEELERELTVVEIGKLTLHNFTLQTPIPDITINRVLVVNTLHLSECSAFSLNFLFAFFLKPEKQIEEIRFVQCTMDPMATNLIGDKIVTLGSPRVLIIKKTQMPYDEE